MHYAILIKVMRHYGLGSLLDRPNGRAFRKALDGIVLATDMSVHFEFMTSFNGLLIAGKDYPLSRRKLLLCQALIKCADISNPVGPRDILADVSLILVLESTAGRIALLGGCTPGGVELPSIAGKVMATATLSTALGDASGSSPRANLLYQHVCQAPP